MAPGQRQSKTSHCSPPGRGRRGPSAEADGGGRMEAGRGAGRCRCWGWRGPAAAVSGAGAVRVPAGVGAGWRRSRGRTQRRDRGSVGMRPSRPPSAPERSALKHAAALSPGRWGKEGVRLERGLGYPLGVRCRAAGAEAWVGAEGWAGSRPQPGPAPGRWRQ